MATLTINGRKVTVDDNFRNLTPEQQEATVNEIAASMGQGEASQQPEGWTPQAEADLAEKVTGTGTFADMTGSGIAKAIPFGDEIVSGMNAPFRAGREWLQGEGFDLGRAYDRNMQVEEELQRRRQERSPIASTAGAVVGGVGAASPLVKGGMSFLQGAKPTLGSLMGRGAAEGAAYGTAYGAGEGRGLEERAYNAAVGGTIGAVTGAATGAAGRVGAGRAKEAAPSVEEIKAAGKAAYKQAEQAGVIFNKSATQALKRNVVDDLTSRAFDPANEPGVVPVLRRLQNMGDNVTFEGLDSLRKVASNGWRPGMDSNNAALSQIIGRIDDLVQGADPAMIMGGNSKDAAKAVMNARSYWSRAKKLETVEKALLRGKQNAAAQVSGDEGRTTMNQLKRVLQSEAKTRGFTPDEMKALGSAAGYSPGQRVAHAIGGLMPRGRLLSSIHGATALGTGGASIPLQAAGAAVGYGAQKTADHIARQSADDLIRMIATGGASSRAQLTPIRQAIIEALIGSGARQLPASISP